MKIDPPNVLRTVSFVVLSSLLGYLPSYAYTTISSSVLQSNGTVADTQAAINSAASGTTIMLPAGSFTWSSGVTISGKGVHLQGAGSGRIIALSTSSVGIGTGSKTFSTTKSGLSISAGQILRIEQTGSIGNWMQGTVSSYSGTTLVLNISSTGGSGTPVLWIISTPPSTTISHNAGATALVSLLEDRTNVTELSDIQFIPGSGTGDVIALSTTSGGRPVQVHDCWIRSTSSSTNGIFTNDNRGIIYKCSFDSSPFSMAPLAVHQKGAPASSWTTPSTMGTADTTGTSNLYIEDCDFHAFLNACDIDDCGRCVWRHNLMNNAGFGTHGADTSNYGVRHYEIYNNEFVFNGYSNGQTFNLNWWCFLRGGTGVIADNIMPDISSQDYGNKPEINATVMNLQRRAGPNGCWGAGVSGNQYPAPRQVGMGYVTGTAGTDAITYKGDSEPLYVWGNSTTPVIGFSDYGGSDCSSPDSTASYIVAGRDVFNNGTSKPGYTKYAYPHPLRVGSTGTQIPATAPTNASISITTP